MLVFVPVIVVVVSGLVVKRPVDFVLKLNSLSQSRLPLSCPAGPVSLCHHC
jgi:hypothetical protein